jgi:hypothetical protein
VLESASKYNTIIDIGSIGLVQNGL